MGRLMEACLVSMIITVMIAACTVTVCGITYLKNSSYSDGAIQGLFDGAQ